MARNFAHLDKSLGLVEMSRWGTKRYRVLKGPSGRRLCRWCGTEVPPKRQVYCSQGCLHNWSMMAFSGYARDQVEARDKGVCASCGLDTRTCPDWRGRGRWGDWRDEKQAWLQVHGYDRWHGTSLWEADHIVAVVDGGHDLGLDNLQTLCVPCHKRKTAELAARRATDRKQSKRAADALVRPQLFEESEVA